MVWKVCQSCKGRGEKSGADGKKVTCPACGSAGGIDTKSV